MDKLDLNSLDLISLLIEHKLPFALYRNMQGQKIHLLWQSTPQVKTFSSFGVLKDVSGFILAPFALEQTHPIVVIEPEYSAHGVAQITEKLKDFAQHHLPKPLKEESKASQSINLCLHIKEDSENLYVRYSKVFSQFMQALQNKTFSKLVLSRKSIYNFEAKPRDVVKIFNLVSQTYPQMMVTLSYTKESGLWLGSTPEILIKGQELTYETMALAGTMPCKDFYNEQGQFELPPVSAWSTKNQEEQAIVADYINKVLQKYSDSLDKQGPVTSQAGNLIHLKTKFTCTLNHKNELINLIEDLHPTPAVCGLPKLDAYNFILENEGYDRSYYSGVIGLLNLPLAFNQDEVTTLDNIQSSALYVNLRCLQMDLDAKQLALYAGGGILVESDAQSEFAETGFKMNTLLKVLESIN